MELFKRDYLVRVQVADAQDGAAPAIEFSGLDISFSVKKNLRSEPNACTLTIYNLTEEHAAALEALNKYDTKRKKGDKRKPGAANAKAPRRPKSGKIRVEIEAGYVGGRGLIFRGDLRRALTEKRGPDRVTTISGEDGGTTILGSRINESFPAGTTLSTVVRACISATGLGEGNYSSVEDILLGQAKVSHTFSLSGLASQELSAITRRAGVTWSVQNGVLRFQYRDVLPERGFVLSARTGMVGAPRRESDGTLAVTSLLNPRLQVGGFVTVDSDTPAHNGSFQIAEIEYKGNSDGGDWYAEMRLKSV